MLTASVGYWENCLSLAVMPEDEPWLRSMGTIGLIIQGREVLLVPNVPASEGGRTPTALEPARHGGLTLQCRWPLDPRPWARFMRHEVAVEIYSETVDLCEGLLFNLPDDHEAPYPKLCQHDEVDLTLIAHREMSRRLLAAAKAGGERVMKETLRNVPDHFRRHIGRQMWKEIIDETLVKMEMETSHARYV